MLQTAPRLHASLTVQGRIIREKQEEPHQKVSGQYVAAAICNISCNQAQSRYGNFGLLPLLIFLQKEGALSLPPHERISVSDKCQ